MGGIPTRIAKNIPQAWPTAAPPRHPIRRLLTQSWPYVTNTKSYYMSSLPTRGHSTAGTALGWKQLLYGWITGAWKVLFNAKAPQLNSNSFISQIICQGWMVILTMWQICNMHLHPSNGNLTGCTQLYAIIENVFHTVQTDPTLSNLLSYTTINQIMQKSIREIRRWIKQSTAHIHAHQEGAKKRATLITNDIQSYFQPRASTPPPQTVNKNLLRPL